MGAMPPQNSQSPVPLGIEKRHMKSGPLARLRPLGMLVFLGLPLAAALSGLLGGGKESLSVARSPAANVTVETPGILRSGNWFETRILVEPHEDIADLTISIDQPLWRSMSIDTLVPDAEKAKSGDGRFAYSFGSVRSGERFLLKVDGQIQPRGLRRLRGSVALSDGERQLAAVPVSILVLP